VADEPIGPIEPIPSAPETASSAFDQQPDTSPDAAQYPALEAAEETSEQAKETKETKRTDLVLADEHGRERRDADDPYEGAVPPGYDWPTHGGYLGCLLSLMASCVIGGFIGTTLFAALSVGQIVPQFVAILLTIAVYAIVIVGLGRLGWVLGKRFFREYPQERYPVWGEDDVEDEGDEEDEEPLPQTIITLAGEQPQEDAPEQIKGTERSSATSASSMTETSPRRDDVSAHSQ
jgi:hypothetical protein